MKERRLGESGMTGVGRWLRRALVLAAALLLVPSVSVAAFRPTAAARLSVGTFSLPAVSGVQFSMACPQGKDAGKVKLKGFTPVPAADGYLAQVSQGGRVLASERLDSPKAVDLLFDRTGTVEFTVIATLKSWTGPPVTSTFIC
jgi:hypothetical protein